MQIFLAFTCIVIAIIVLIKLKEYWVVSGLQNQFYPALLCKLLGGIALGILYRYFYQGGDTTAMYQDSLMLVEKVGFNSDYFGYIFGWKEMPDELLATTQATGHKALWMSLIAGIIGVFSNDNYWLISIYLSLFAFLGIWAMVQAFYQYLAIPKWILAVCWLYWPSLLVWGSGLLKEPLMIGSIGWIIAITLQVHLDKRQSILQVQIAQGLWFLICAWLLLQVKYYFFAPLLISIGGLWGAWHAYRNAFLQKYRIAMISGFALMLVILVWAGQSLYPALRLNQFPEQIIQNQQHMYALSSASSSLIVYEGITAAWPSLISFLPQAFLEGTLRPFFWEEGHWLKKTASLEGIVMVLAAAWALTGWLKKRTSRSLLNTYEKYLLVFACLYLGITACLLPLAAPNIGALMRYRIGYWPLMLMLLLLVGHKKRAVR